MIIREVQGTLREILLREIPLQDVTEVLLLTEIKARALHRLPHIHRAEDHHPAEDFRAVEDRAVVLQVAERDNSSA